MRNNRDRETPSAWVTTLSKLFIHGSVSRQYKLVPADKQ